jgi:2-methylcitrate dehydratase PrpD
MESNHPSAGLRRPAGFEDRIGHQAAAAPPPTISLIRACARMSGMDPRYRTAMLDWLACAVGGAGQRAARAARAAGDGRLERVAAAGTAGHVLDFDDTWAPGLLHLSAATAPAALLLGAELGATVGEALAAYAVGFEAAAAVAEASHPALYEAGWHPTAVCGAVGAAVAGARLLELEGEPADSAVALAVLSAGGLRAAFGGDGKSLQVGLAAAAGVHAARLAAAGASVDKEAVVGAGGFERAYGGRWAHPAGPPAIEQNWIKAWPCCLQTHGAIEAAARVRDGSPPGGPLTVVVHPRSRQAAPYDDVDTGLRAKFSIPYTTAYTLLHGPPTVASFAGVDESARRLAAARVEVRTDEALGQSECVLEHGGDELARVTAALGSPQRPFDAAGLAAKVRGLAGTRLDGVLDDDERPVADVVAAAGL